MVIVVHYKRRPDRLRSERCPGVTPQTESDVGSCVSNPSSESDVRLAHRARHQGRRRDGRGRTGPRGRRRRSSRRASARTSCRTVRSRTRPDPDVRFEQRQALGLGELLEDVEPRIDVGGMVDDGEDLVGVLDGAVDDRELVDIRAHVVGEQQARAHARLAEPDRILALRAVVVVVAALPTPQVWPRSRIARFVRPTAIPAPP